MTLRLSRKREQDLVLAVIRDEKACVVFPLEAYTRADGALAVHRDGLQELLHRRLYRQIRLTNLGRAKLERTCDTFGCVNPFHFALRAGLQPGSRSRCANGHLYEEVGVTPTGHCVICAERRAKRREREGLSQAQINAAKTHCPANHPYNEANTYVAHSPNGNARRRCRACNLAVSRRRRGHSA